MQETNYILRFGSDYPANSLSAMLPTLAPGLQKSRDIAPIVTASQTGNALPLLYAPEHNPPPAGEEVGSQAQIPGYKSIFVKIF